MPAIDETWICKRCGAATPQRLNACPFCGADAAGKLPPTALAILAGCCGRVLAVWAGFIILFALFGLAAAAATGDWNGLVVCLIFGAVLGFLFGVGALITDATDKVQGRAKEVPTQAEISRNLGDLAFGTLGPGARILAFAVSAVRWARTTDFKAASRGRGRRAFIGGIVLGLLAALMLIAASEMIPAHQNNLPLGGAVIFILVASAIGATLGALSDAF